MTVFIVLGVFHYEGCSILKVFDTFEKAQAFQADPANLELGQNTNVFFDEVTIQERTVE